MNYMRSKKRWIFIIPAALAGMVLFTFLGGSIVRLLWNALLPPLFGFHQVTFWQALGLLVLARILFGGHGFLGGGRHRRRWEHMSPEERERFREGMRARFGMGSSEPPAAPSEPRP